MKIHLDSTAEDTRIELIPLIDVIFCVLTFFILASLELTRQQAINIDLPTASTGKGQPREILIVSLDPVGQIYIEQQPVKANELEQELKSYVALNPTQMMVLYAPKEAQYHQVVNILDTLRKVGGSRVGLATLPGSSRSQDTQPTPLNSPQVPEPNSNPLLLNPSGIPGLQQPSRSPGGLGSPGVLGSPTPVPGNLPGSLSTPAPVIPSPGALPPLDAPLPSPENSN